MASRLWFDYLLDYACRVYTVLFILWPWYGNLFSGPGKVLVLVLTKKSWSWSCERDVSANHSTSVIRDSIFILFLFFACNAALKSSDLCFDSDNRFYITFFYLVLKKIWRSWSWSWDPESWSWSWSWQKKSYLHHCQVVQVVVQTSSCCKTVATHFWLDL